MEDGIGWVVPQLVGGTSYLLTELPSDGSAGLGIGLEATLGYAVPLTDATDGTVAMGISVMLQWTRIGRWDMSFR